MSEQHARKWVRNHTIAGYVVGRFQGESEAHRRISSSSRPGMVRRWCRRFALIPIDNAYMVRQARLELECVIWGILEGGLDRDDHGL